MNAIEVRNLTKKFGDLKALDNINLEIKENEIFGLLGPNGAGKTTLISILSTILKPTSGNAKIFGYDVVKQMDEVRKIIGIVFQDPTLDIELTGWENLDFHGRLYGMDKNLREKRIKEVLNLVGLEEKANKIVKTYSGGMKRRLEIARGLMHHPKILFLDEPTLGLDPQTRRNIWEYIKNLKENEEITIILTTHYMEEADFLCDRVAIIDHGKIIALDTPEKLKNLISSDIISLEVDNIEKMKNILSSYNWVKKLNVINGKININVENGDKLIIEIIEIAKNNGIKINSVNLKKPTLEDVFIHYTGRTIREEKGDSIDIMRQRIRLGR